MYLAERPLYKWSKWHGGEELWVKVIETANVVPLVATRIFDAALEVVGATSGLFSVRAQSWVSAVVFLGLSSVQWFWVGRAIARKFGAA